MRAELTDRTREVLAHLLADPYADHYVSGVVRALGMPYHHVDSAFGLLVAHGWAVLIDGGGNVKPLRLTQAGRHQAQQLVEAGEVGVPLRDVDEEDPQLADRVRAMLGWPARHTQPGRCA